MDRVAALETTMMIVQPAALIGAGTMMKRMIVPAVTHGGMTMTKSLLSVPGLVAGMSMMMSSKPCSSS